VPVGPLHTDWPTGLRADDRPTTLLDEPQRYDPDHTAASTNPAAAAAW
jgi:hypothetical protein